MGVAGATLLMDFHFAQTCQTNFETSPMSHVVLLIDGLGDNKAEVIRRVRLAVSIKIGDAIKAIEMGEPIFRRSIFDRNDPGFPDRLHELLEWFEHNSVGYHAFEVLNDEPFDRSNTLKYYMLNATRLKGIIESTKASLNRQRRMGHLESGEQVNNSTPPPPHSL